MKNAGVTLCLLLVAAVPLHAGLGDVTYVPCEPDKGLQIQFLRASNPEFGKAGPDSGTVNPDAIFATLGSGTRVVLVVAVDSKTPDAKSPDVVRLDFSGKGKFNDEHVVTLKPSGPGEVQRIGPVTLDVQREGETLPVTVHGSYHKSGTYRSLHLRLGVAAQATCRFGDKTYPVRLMDGNANLRVNNAPKPMGRRGRTVGLTPGDTIAVDLGDGEFGKSVRKAFYGQPILVNQTWYEVKLSPDGKKITSKPLDLKTGQIKIDHDRYSMMLVGEKYWLRLSGGRKAVSVPQDRYTVTAYSEQTPAEASKATFGYTRAAKPFDVVEGKVTALEIGSPLTASARVSQPGSTVGLSLNLVDAAGTRVSYLRAPGGGRPPAPTVMIRDETGKEIHSGKMRYG